MKQFLFASLAWGILLSAIGCSSDDDLIVPPTVPEVTYPVEIPVIDCILPGGLTWRYGEMHADSVYVIHAAKDLTPYLSAPLPDSILDFDRYSLVFVGGVAEVELAELSQWLVQTAADSFQLHVHVSLDYAQRKSPWFVAVVVPKLSDDAVVQPHIQQDYSNNAGWQRLDTLAVEETLARRITDSLYQYSRRHYISENSVFVVSSADMFLKLCADIDMAAQIDFEHNTLLWGGVGLYYIVQNGIVQKSDTVTSKHLYIHPPAYKYEITIDKLPPPDLGSRNHLFWAIYPRKIQGPVVLVRKERPISENLPFPYFLLH
jgi:hypothetical protein